MNATTTYRIYVASLSDYNSGHLLGRWIDANQDADDIAAEVAEMLRESKFPNVMVDVDGEQVPSAEEWAIHDYELGGIKISESESFETVAELAAALDEHGEPFAAWWNNENRDDVDLDAFQEAYQGEFDSLADYVEDFWNQTGEYKRDDKNWWSPINYVDWERMARDLELGGDVWTHEADGKVYVFNNH